MQGKIIQFSSLEIEDGSSSPFILLVIAERSYEKKTGDEACTTRLVLRSLRLDHFTTIVTILKVLKYYCITVIIILFYYSTIASFYHIWSRERAKYETVIHCSVPV